MHIIDWVLRQYPDRFFGKFVAQVANPGWLSERPRGLRARLLAGFKQFPCDILFIHRDAERQNPDLRNREINKALAATSLPPHIPIVPVRMTEAWLLIEENAIRRAADNPNGTADLAVPPIRKLEDLPDPKKVLRESLLMASELKGRRRDQFKRRMPDRVGRVATLIQDYSPLRQLAAFQQFEEDAHRVLDSLRPY